MKKNKYIIVFVTVPDKKTADKIIKNVLEKRLAACVNIIKNLDSFYWWKGKTEHSQELLLIMKTVKSKFSSLEKYVKAAHPYEVPEIISAEISLGSKEYLDWIEEYTRKAITNYELRITDKRR
ncbi:MAG: divalent-cation tolerance protein CutA [Endomicrobia bacterium]|nr:divalent-cation tolerance protein CutA [Endomicrobiia bacterium]